jgi:Na+/melibiose symporter-like transporter
LPVLFLFPFWLVSRYRITRAAHAEIRRQLELRHIVANGTGIK